MRVCVRARVVRSPPRSTADLFLGDDDVFAPLLADFVEDAGHHRAPDVLHLDPDRGVTWGHKGAHQFYYISIKTSFFFSS
jgi:hypothetical protein